MNTANLQLEGVLAVMASLLEALREKQLLTGRELADVLDRAEEKIGAPPLREMRAANIEAAHFPIRFLRLAANDRSRSFAELATAVGQSKPEHEA